MTVGPVKREPMRVLVAIDGSAAAARAVDLVSGIRWPADTRIVVAEAAESGSAEASRKHHATCSVLVVRQNDAHPRSPSPELGTPTTA